MFKSIHNFSRHYDPELPLTDSNKYFEDHKHKHKTIRDMTFFMNLLMQMVQISMLPALKLMKGEQEHRVYYKPTN